MSYTNNSGGIPNYQPPVTSYVVQQGDTFYSIARKVYGTPEPGWRTILDANNMTDPRQLYVGQTLLIP
jgi:nucleoid-associated protein YgaU